MNVRQRKEMSTSKYQQTLPSSTNLKYAELTNLDLSTFDQPGGKQRLVAQLKDSIESVGFFHVTNSASARKK
ncbi:uncharacterized protein BDZ99DRAFT_465314 [Mytilinidion resinicola]|uniref:Non-haem dioxygenase N-terminal domain-containing protein n=1 Tax=Mytilinidion resinicola TaxID=574789 RepID=A0A6A6YF60_9PEZI|nr:uncharacterized protein BDZ99DRAFT_465314 [Mytilinidion resinicola]KAF2807432.1 hypothetical protein BDZ99DRAFT_465314 [Mytilinidion resinicola]